MSYHVTTLLINIGNSCAPGKSEASPTKNRANAPDQQLATPARAKASPNARPTPNSPNARCRPQTPKPWNTPRYVSPIELMLRQWAKMKSRFSSFPPRTQKRPTAKYPPRAQATQMQSLGPRPQSHKFPRDSCAPGQNEAPLVKNWASVLDPCLVIPPELNGPKCKL